MQTQIKKLEQLTWINIVKPEILELRKILTANNLNESLAEEIVNPTSNAKVDTMRNSVYLTLHFPFSNKDKIVNQEVDIIIKANLIITSSYSEINYIKDYIEKLTPNIKYHGGIYFSNFLETTYANLEREIENTAEDIKIIETGIFSSEERATIENIANASKKVFDLRSKLRTHKEVLDVFANDTNKIFGFEFLPYPEKVKSKYNELMNNLDNQKENLTELKDTIDFLLTNKTNQIVKFFTVVSFILLPMTFLASFFGMNTKFPSELVSSQFGTVYIMILMLSISVLVLTYLHYKKMI